MFEWSKHPSRPILNGRVNFPLMMAPMVGLSHVAIRRVVRSYLPRGSETLWPSEMLSSFKLPRQNLSTLPEAMKDANEQLWAPQILGNQPEPIAKSVQMLVNHGAAAIDINMGCPVQKALKHNYGVALMGDAAYAAQVVAMTKSATSVPVSVKLRAGLQGDLSYLKDFAQGLEGAGADWLTLHPRLASEKRRGEARWEQIAWVREHVRVPVIGNGDIQVVDDVDQMIRETGCDGVMVGRALLARPWLLWQWGERHGLPAPLGRETERPPATPEEEGQEFGRVVLAVLDATAEIYTEELALRKFRFFLRHAAVWLEFGHELERVAASEAQVEKLRARLESFFQYPHRLAQRTQLRQ